MASKAQVSVSDGTDSGPVIVARPALTMEVITSQAGFKALAPEWRELLGNSDSDSLFLTWEWTYTWWRHCIPQKKLHIVAVRASGLLIAIAPLAERGGSVKRMRPFGWLEFIAAGIVGSDYLSFIVRRGYEQAGVEQVSECLDTYGLSLELVRVERSSPVMRRFVKHVEQYHWQAEELTTTYCPYVSLSGLCWSSYLDGLDRSHRGYLKRKMNKLNKDFSVTLALAETEGERALAFDTFLMLHHKRWASSGIASDLDNKSMIDFHRDFSRVSLKKAWLRLYTLNLNGAPAASVYLFKYNKVFYYYQMGYDPHYSRYSVGMLVLALAIQQAIADAAIEFDFLHDNEAYKYLWAKQHRALVRIEAYPPKVSGRILRQLMQAKCSIKKGALRLSR